MNRAGRSAVPPGSRKPLTSIEESRRIVMDKQVWKLEDPELAACLANEEGRQRDSLEMIASESIRNTCLRQYTCYFI